jgi:glycosyltransferase involved in cell wall biosynthesis
VVEPRVATRRTRVRDTAITVALDAGPLLDPQTGVGRYVRELGHSLEALGVDVSRYAVALSGRSDPAIRRWRRPARAMQELWMRFGHPVPRRLVGSAAVVHGTNFVLPPLGGAAGVVTVHDLSWLRDDTFPTGHRLRRLVPWSVGRAGAVAVPTACVSGEVASSMAVDPSRIVVTPEGVSPVFFGATPLADESLRGLGITRPYALAVGTIEPRKNLARLLQAWRGAAEALQGWKLVLAGPRGWGPGLPRTPDVVPTGWISDATLPGLAAGAEFFCYPSLYEGFGLPPLEAMAAGTPALVGRYSAASEVLGDAAHLVDPCDVDDIAAGLARMASDSDHRRRLALAGRARAALFTWERTGLRTLEAYDLALMTNYRRAT